MKTFLVLISLISCTFSFGQNKFNQWTISGGATQSLLRGIHRLPFRDFENSFKFTVGAQLNADWGLMRRVSFGVGITHHRHHLTIQDYQYTVGTVSYTETPTQSVYATAYYMRFFFHIRPVFEDTDEKVDLYWGASHQFIFFQSFNTSKDPDFPEFDERFQAIPCAVGGVRYYPTDNFGIHCEVSLPGVYTFSAGLAYRFKNK